MMPHRFRPCPARRWTPGCGVAPALEALESRVLLSVGVQIVTPDPIVQSAGPSEMVSVDVMYSTSDPVDENLTGLGLRLHFDSSKLSFDSLTNTLPPTDFFQSDDPVDDDLDLDGDPATDMYVLTAWADFNGGNGGWPGDGATPALLYTIHFTTSATFDTATTFNFTASSVHTGRTLAATSGMIEPAPADPDPPKVTEVLFLGSTWSNSGAFNFVQFLADNGLGVGGFAMVGGAAQLTTTVPWTNANRLILRFSEEVANLAGNVQVRGTNGLDRTPGSGDETYNLTPVSAGLAPAGANGAFQAVYAFDANLVADKLRIVVVDVVTDLAGNALDGEWTTSVSTFGPGSGSGDGVAGGPFNFRANALPGDVVTSAFPFVLAGDAVAAIGLIGNFTTSPTFNARADLDGNGFILAGDAVAVIGRIGSTLPFAEPAAAPASASNPLAALAGDASKPANGTAAFDSFVQNDGVVRYSWLDADEVPR